MKNTCLLGTVAVCLVPGIAASPSISSQHQVANVKPRALPNALDGYAPVHVTCPKTRPSLRNGTALSPEETSWLEARRGKTLPALKDFFGHVQIDGFDAVSYLESHSRDLTNIPTIGLAISGGGLTAALNGAGTFKAFDSRTEGTMAKGQLGGLLQSTTYFSALSGGSWMLGSAYVNNFTTVSALQEQGNLWNFSSGNIFAGPPNMDPQEFWGNITAQVKTKRAAGFVTSDPDVWGRVQGYFFFNASHGGVDYTWSSIAKTQAFQDAEMPLPVVVVKGQSSDKALEAPTNSEPIYEVSPWEFGTYDNSIHGFVPLEYLGTRFINGIVPENETCVRGFDNAGFITGSSSDIWNQGKSADIAGTLESMLPGISTQDPEEAQFLKLVIAEVISATNSTNSTLTGSAAYEPNPFYQYNTNSSPFAHDKRLTIVDGGEGGQNIPFNPLIQRKRNVDVIFGVDSLGSDGSWPTGSAIISTYERTLDDLANTSFPYIPDQNTILNLGLNAHPTFFGCNSSNLTTLAPLVVYLPNHPVTYNATTTLTDTDFSSARRDGFIMNGYNVATQANGTLDSEWTTCVGCAILSRSFDRTGTTVPEACNRCFQRYCWNGTIDDQTPAPYNPSVLLPNTTSTAGTSPTASSMGSSLDSAVWSAIAMVGMALFVIG
ncbi:lysophospholipase 1 [Aspergillus bombycis]|uniref:Lysophospholipase n=1 Tax=Aspergillus bombycis TaxID=109264 RepID=A0A1F8A7K6_9EURO|nr:lysophospholipase 1 [Aspergillus bombycis]OGM47671.1 lysophospholipase 1 [Aspergillus bombycis]